MKPSLGTPPKGDGTHQAGGVGEGGEAEGGGRGGSAGQALPEFLAKEGGERGEEAQPQLGTAQQGPARLGGGCRIT